MAELHISSVVINCWDYTKGMLDSIKTKYSYKVRIIDQESTDGTGDRCAERGIDCFKKSPRVSLSEAWNFSIQESLKDDECKYIMLVNNDIIFHERTIDNLIDSMNVTKYAMVTASNIAPTWRNDIEGFKKLKVNDDDKDFDFKPITNWREEGPDFSCFLINKQTIKDIGWFDENFNPAYFEDNDYHLRILKGGKHAKRIMRAPYFHYGSMTVTMNPTLNLGAHRTGNVFFTKWGAEPSGCMDGEGFNTPYNNPSYDHKYWTGCEKYSSYPL